MRGRPHVSRLRLRLTVVLVALVGAAGAVGAVGAAPATAATCPRELPVRAQTTTSNAAALQRIGVVRAIARGGRRVRDLRVTLVRGGRVVAKGSRARSFATSAPLRLTFRRPARPGSASLVVSGKVAGCAATRRTRRTLWLDANDLPIRVVATDRDARADRLAVTLSATRTRRITDIRARLLDVRGETIADVTRDAALHTRTRVEFALPAAAAGRRWLLVSANVQGDSARSTFAEAIDLDAVAPADPSPPPPASSAGAIVQQVAVSWSGGRWQSHDSASFSAPGIGTGQLVCRPDTQWIRVFPADRSRDVAMTLWTSRDWEGGGESTIRESQMTQFTGADFNEGLNKFTPPEKRSHGSFVGVLGPGLPSPGTFGGGRAPMEVRLAWSWDFTNPAAASCTVTATFTSQGPGTDGPVARGLALGWDGAAAVPADATTATRVPGLGTVSLRCDAGSDGLRQLVVEPDAALPALAVTTYQGSEGAGATLASAPYVVPLPNNGLVEAATTAGTPLRLLVASRWKVNDPDPAQNSCRLSSIVVTG
jgi:hypothetical protein